MVTHKAARTLHDPHLLFIFYTTGTGSHINSEQGGTSMVIKSLLFLGDCLIESGSIPSDSFLSLLIPIFLDSRHPGDCVLGLRISGGFYVLSRHPGSGIEIFGYYVLLNSRHRW